MDLPLQIDPGGGAPLHRQVYDSIRTAILGGRLQPGDRLPPSRVLARDLSLSRSTVTEAYDQLEAEGYLEGRTGSGTYVAPSLPAEQRRAPLRARTFALSRWGRDVAAHGATRPEAYRYDFRPHRIAQDSFPWAAWGSAVDAALQNRDIYLSYPPPAGLPDLREAIAAHVRRYRGVVCEPDRVVVVNGSQQGLNLLVRVLLERGERVAVEDPGYPAARVALEAHGLDVHRIPVDADGLEVDLLNGQPYRLVHVTPSHQDPTGATLSLSRRLQLLEWADHTGCLIVEDDYDSEFRYEGRPVESLQGLDRDGLVVYAGTFSKSVLAGLRLGFLILPPGLVGPVIAARALWDSGSPVLEQAALAYFLRSGEYERHIRRMRRLYRSRRDALRAALSSELGECVTIGERHGGLNVLVEVRTPRSDDEIVRAAAAAGIGLRSAAPYYSRAPRTPHFLIGFGGLPEGEIRAGIAALAPILNSP